MYVKVNTGGATEEGFWCNLSKASTAPTAPTVPIASTTYLHYLHHLIPRTPRFMRRASEATLRQATVEFSGCRFDIWRLVSDHYQGSTLSTVDTVRVRRCVVRLVVENRYDCTLESNLSDLDSQPHQGSSVLTPGLWVPGLLAAGL